MKTILNFPTILFLLLFALILAGFSAPDFKSANSESGNTIVVLKFKALPGQSKKAMSELVKLLEKVKSEPHFVSIKLHVDPKDETNILLYEEWDDASYYNSTHMETAHIGDFMSNSGTFLIGPPEIAFWKIEKEFK